MEAQSPEVAECLLRGGADPGARMFGGGTALFSARHRPDPRLPALLRRFGAPEPPPGEDSDDEDEDDEDDEDSSERDSEVRDPPSHKKIFRPPPPPGISGGSSCSSQPPRQTGGA